MAINKALQKLASQKSVRKKKLSPTQKCTRTHVKIQKSEFKFIYGKTTGGGREM